MHHREFWQSYRAPYFPLCNIRTFIIFFFYAVVIRMPEARLHERMAFDSISKISPVVHGILVCGQYSRTAGSHSQSAPWT